MDNHDHIEIEPIKSQGDESAFGATHCDLPTYSADFTLGVLYSKCNKEEILIPEFQRRYVWSIGQASKLIESFLLGLPVSPISLYSNKDSGTLLVVDGQQRMKSIVFYFKGTFGESGLQDKKAVFRLRLDEKSKWNGKTFEDLSEEDQGALKSRILRAFIMKRISPDKDTGNTAYEGEFHSLLNELDGYSAWRDNIGKSEPDRYSREPELIHRFLTLFAESDKYKRHTKNILSDFMKEHIHSGEIETFHQISATTTDSTHKKLGIKQFHARQEKRVQAR